MSGVVSIPRCPVHGFAEWCYEQRRIGGVQKNVVVCGRCGGRTEMVAMMPVPPVVSNASVRVPFWQDAA